MGWQHGLFLFVVSEVTIIFGIWSDVSTEKSLVWGPGLEKPELDLPVRYFFVHLVDLHGQNVTSSRGNIIDVTWKSDGCRFRRQVIDRHDGSYVVRFRLFQSCPFLDIQLQIRGQHIALSPYRVRKSSGEWLQSESCNCVESQSLPSMAEWLVLADCDSLSRPQMAQDFSRWKMKSVDFGRILNISLAEWAHVDRKYSVALCHYQIVQNEIYRKCYGEYVGFHMFADQILTSLARKMRLPNMEFLLNLGDWPLEVLDNRKRPNFVPIFSWCGSESTGDIVLPTYELTESVLKMADQVSLDVHTVLGKRGIAWNNKIDKAVFRGRDSSEQRLKLILIAKQNPQVLDAGITRFFFFQEHKSKYEPTVDQKPFSDFFQVLKHNQTEQFEECGTLVISEMDVMRAFQYRYVLNMDGTVAAYRFPFLLAGDSLIMKQNSSFYEHFYAALQPYVHYIPLNRNLSDLVEKITWARQNPSHVREIIANTKQFVLDHLQPQHIFCYHALALKRYADLLEDVPVRPNEYSEQVPKTPTDSYGQCNCKVESLSDKTEL